MPEPPPCRFAFPGGFPWVRKSQGAPRPHLHTQKGRGRPSGAGGGGHKPSGRADPTREAHPTGHTHPHMCAGNSHSPFRRAGPPHSDKDKRTFGERKKGSRRRTGRHWTGGRVCPRVRCMSADSPRPRLFTISFALRSLVLVRRDMTLPLQSEKNELPFLLACSLLALSWPPSPTFLLACSLLAWSPLPSLPCPSLHGRVELATNR